MLEFKTPEIDDKVWVDKCLKHAKNMNCEYTFGNLYIWSTAYSTQICHYKDFMICRWGKGDDINYSLPIGQGDFTDAVNQIIADAKSQGVKPVIYGITSTYLTMLKEAFLGKFTYELDDDTFDYIYSTEKMANLVGKKYHAKRNHINNFKKNNPDWQFEEININNIPDCISFHTDWIRDKDTDSDDSDYSFEFEAVLCAFEHFERLNLKGGFIRVNGKVIAYTLGEEQSEKCFVSHFEKAHADIQGAYAIINQEFTKNCLATYTYVNREEDLGIDGLRKAKQSYYPEILLEKHTATYID